MKATTEKEQGWLNAAANEDLLLGWSTGLFPRTSSGRIVSPTPYNKNFPI